MTLIKFCRNLLFLNESIFWLIFFDFIQTICIQIVELVCNGYHLHLKGMVYTKRTPACFILNQLVFDNRTEDYIKYKKEVNLKCFRVFKIKRQSSKYEANTRKNTRDKDVSSDLCIKLFPEHTCRTLVTC